MREIETTKRGSACRALLATVLATVTLAGCSGDGDSEYVERPVHELYNEAMDALESRNSGQAAILFDEVERQHPYSAWATKSRLMAAYSHYVGNRYDDAIVAIDRFIQLHPSNRDTPYAHYLKGLSYYEQISDVARDQNMTQQALGTFDELIRRYPASGYARDARIKLDLINDHLAGTDMEIGRYYLEQGHYHAAINRFITVVQRFQTTSHVPEALHRLVEVNLVLGAETEARKWAAFLSHNFRGDDWYGDSYGLIEGKEEAPSQGPWYQFW
ncbi:MAG: outer membrane protein assembly factor BamD [Rhodospirillales bacterium]|nr:outer membrane protein assembly factor BamD [Rhodospirillales bacterium]